MLSPIVYNLITEINKIDHTTMVCPQEANNAVGAVLDYINKYGYNFRCILDHEWDCGVVTNSHWDWVFVPHTYRLEFVVHRFNVILNFRVEITQNTNIIDYIDIDFENNVINSIKWGTNYALHRYNKPAIIAFYSNGMVRSNQWYWKHHLERYNGPSTVDYNPRSGSVSSMSWDSQQVTIYNNGSSYTGSISGSLVKHPLTVWLHKNNIHDLLSMGPEMARKLKYEVF